ncbi:hypothetical protein [Mesoterricola sediminis]|uniref:Uncharacterized protein n=1 Tax=Mesoterricola sediminis TaxID=2927980 RepID=A0AA48KFQ2_9BACT|nr:hypothetical protein [Mesoterricola sediminis]BDU78532.1 hypothetical protein METESE_34900 [Mesoterricola sediminis]
MPRSPAPLIDPPTAERLSGGISIGLASRSAANEPSLARALGCLVSADRRRITLFVLASQARALVKDIQAHGTLAVVFSQPSTHQSWQFKGVDAQVTGPRPGDARRVEAYQRRFVEEVRPLGFPEELVRTLLAFRPEDLLRLTVTPTSGFLQTPGKDAGAPLEALP